MKHFSGSVFINFTFEIKLISKSKTAFTKNTSKIWAAENISEKPKTLHIISAKTVNKPLHKTESTESPKFSYNNILFISKLF